MGLRAQIYSILMEENRLGQGFWQTSYDLSRPILPRIIPADIISKIVKVTNWLLARKVSDFISNNFGTPQKTPILKIPPSELYENSSHTFVWLSELSTPLGSIRYRPWCQDNKKLYWQVDCFCVHKNHRGNGIGSWLLKYLHSWANYRGIPYAIFLKEGHPLPIPRLPFKTGVYAFMETQNLPRNIQHNSINLKKINVSIAKSWIHSFSGIANSYSLFPCDIEPNYVSSWYIYKSGTIWLITRVERTNQYGPSGHLGWLTNIYKSPSWNTISFQEQTKHITASSIEISKNHGWGAVWIDSEWVEVGNNSPWKLDGPYYFYSFQW